MQAKTHQSLEMRGQGQLSKESKSASEVAGIQQREVPPDLQGDVIGAERARDRRKRRATPADAEASGIASCTRGPGYRRC